MIRQTAFEGTQPLLKGSLHCHTTRSDGLLSPEEVIRLHGRYGYDFLALTDHRIYNRTDYAPDSGVLILPGMEMDRLLALPGRRWFHTVCLGPAGDPPFAQDERFESGVVDDAEAYQPLLDSLHAAGFLTIYCHPEWSMTPARLFEKQRGNFAMEIWNSGCVLENGLDGNAAYWDELLLQGIRIFGVATDDGHARHHHGNGWVRVRAEKNVPDILRALREGAFYASCGPELHDFYIADGKSRGMLFSGRARGVPLRQPSAAAGSCRGRRAYARGNPRAGSRALSACGGCRRAGPQSLDQSDFPVLTALRRAQAGGMAFPPACVRARLRCARPPRPPSAGY